MPADQPDDVDETFARIVADYDALAERDADVPWPASEDVDESTVAAAEPVAPQRPAALPAETSATDPLNSPATWDDEGHFVPPTPPPLPRPEPRTLLAWVGTLGAPVAFVFAAMTGLVLPRLLTGALILGFVAGVVWLIVTISRSDDERYDPDDGAVV